MHAMFFRSFYLIFLGLFAWLLVGVVSVTLLAAHSGSSMSTIVGVLLCALCGGLMQRAVRYMRE